MGVVSGMTFGVKADFVQFDADRFLQDQKAAIVRAFKNAARGWLTVMMQRIPKDTGFLRSAFMNLAAFLGVRVTDSGAVKRGRDLYGHEKKLESLKNRAKGLKNELVKRGYLREEYAKGSKRPTFKRNIPKPHTRKQKQERPKAFQKKQQRNKKSGFSQTVAEKATQLKEEGLNIHSAANNDEKKNSKIFKREQNKKYYQQQRERKQADRMLKRLASLQKQIQQQKLKVKAALARTKPLRLKSLPGYDKWENVTVEKTTYVRQKVMAPNPAYPTNAAQLIRMKKAGTLPPKTIEKEEMVAQLIKKTVRRRIPRGDERRLVNVYRKYYYPMPGQKGPLKTPLGGIRYGTPVSEIMKLNSQPMPQGEISEERTQINKGGFEVTANEFTQSSFGVNKSLNMASSRMTTNSRLEITFDYKADIRYLRIMDLFILRGKNGPYRGTPWRAMSSANKEFMTILRQELANNMLPFTSYLIVAKGTLKTPGFKGGL